MKRTLGIATILCLVLGGPAFAGRGGHGRGGGGGGGVVVRDHRGGGGGGGPRPAVVVRDHRGPRVTHVRVSNGRYMFPGGVVRVYKRPVIRERYYDVHVRPPLVVEAYDPVPGYVWIAGGWTWGGSEWVWSPGYWAVSEEPAVVAPAPVVTGGVNISVGAGISIH